MLVLPKAKFPGGGRSLQLSCNARNIYLDADRGQYQCTLEEYCDVLRASDGPLSNYVCVGDLEGEFSIVSQDYQCDDPGSSTWLQTDRRLCYTVNNRVDFFQHDALQRSFAVDFVEGFSFNYVAEAQLCPFQSNVQCSCVASIEGRQCRSCTVCNDGAAVAEVNAFLYDLDCSNIAEGLTRSCDPSDTWASFFQKVNDAEVTSLVSQPAGTTVVTQTPTATPTERPTESVQKIPDNTVSQDSMVNRDEGLSNAAIGGIVGGAVGVVVAMLLAVILIAVTRRSKATEDRDQRDVDHAVDKPDNMNQSQLPTVPRPSVPVMAEVVLADQASLPVRTGPNFPFMPASSVVKPDFKDQARS